MGRLFGTSETNKTSTAPTTVKGRLFKEPYVPKKTLGGKIIKGAGELAKDIARPVVTMAARPVQLAAVLGGTPVEKVDKVTLGGLIAPTPKNTSDVVKDLGRAGQTVLTGGLGSVAKGAIGLAAGKAAPTLGKLAATGAIEGAGYGTGVALEQKGSDVTGKDILLNAGLGAGVGAVAPVALKAAGRLFKTKPKVSPEVPPAVTQEPVEDLTKGLVDTTDTYNLGETGKILSDQGYNKDKASAILYRLNRDNPTQRWTPAEIEKATQGLTPDVKPKIAKPKGFTGESPITGTKQIVQDTPIAKQEIPKGEQKNNYKFNEDQYKKADDFVRQSDPEFEKGGSQKYQSEYSKLSREDAIEISVGTKQAPVGIPATVVKALTKELPDLTKAERNRLAKSTFVQSKAGSELAGAKYLTDEVINDPFVYTARKQQELVDKALKKGYTKKTINRFLDDLECPI